MQTLLRTVTPGTVPVATAERPALVRTAITARFDVRCAVKPSPARREEHGRRAEAMPDADAGAGGSTADSAGLPMRRSGIPGRTGWVRSRAWIKNSCTSAASEPRLIQESSVTLMANET